MVASAQVDTVLYKSSEVVDSTLSGKSIFSLLTSESGGAEVKIHQSQAIAGAMSRHISANADKSLTGYRVRIYFDNQQNSRNLSQAIVARFSSSHPGVSAYRSYQNPFFKVTVGDFRTKSEALELFSSIKGEFPQAFIVKEKINYPPVDLEGQSLRYL